MPQPRPVENVDAGVDLLDAELLRRGVLLLDDAEHLSAVIAANHATQTLRFGGVNGDESHRRIAGAAHVDQFGKQVRLDEGHVARQDQNLAQVLRSDCESGADRVRSAKGFGLQSEVRGVGKDLGDSGRRRRIDDQRTPAADIARRVEHEGEHWAPAELVQDLGLSRFHARTEPAARTIGRTPSTVWFIASDGSTERPRCALDCGSRVRSP